jgi:GTP-dependent dephospho-CoA kinase
MPLTPDALAELKKPFGTLIQDSQVTKEKIVSAVRGGRVMTVGDATTERLLTFGIVPDVSVVDGKERRRKRAYPEFDAAVITCKNPAGVISKQAIDALKQALKAKPPVRVVVEGEEDLLALPVFAMAPDGVVVLYGQPLEGLVLVRITPAKRNRAKNLMDRIGVKE